MESISIHDRNILRRRAQIQLEYADSPQNDIILEKWRAQAEGRREAPPVRLLFSNFRHEVITPRLQCKGEQARWIEASLLNTLVGRELFDDDTPISPTFDIHWHTHVQQTMEEQEHTQFEATDKFGKSVILESVKIDLQSPECITIIKSLSEIYATTFVVTAKQLLFGYPEVVSTVSHYKPFEPIIKNKGIEHINWAIAEEKMKAGLRQYFEGKEVVLPKDTFGWFIIVKDKKPLALFEAKENDSSISKSGRYFGKKLGIPLFQIVRKAKKVEAFPESCYVIPASNFLMLAG